jgi:hypothetical protein
MDSKVAEHLFQVVIGRAGADAQARGDLGV